VVVALFVAFWLVANEMLSILENIDCIGVPIPNFLRKVIVYFLHSTEKEAEAAVPDDELENLNVEDAGND
jgi:phage-related holin